ncbi:Aromatic peroxygenase [Mycena indigotica]|uniref:Aromatic peroxygenase n=1 Tax=Mycena indigotica TaxID=2126181 RepID=A0A8H6T2U1_9AGAR|nr:Aromatic peroxygenase [Mycena indigotica]KAF7310011.1 Aromatic peroxygenase [Mycena indigotica]
MVASGSVTTTAEEASFSTIGSFFRNQTFPANWHRAAAPVTGATVGPIIGQLVAGVGVPAGRNNPNGIYVADPLPPAPFNSSFACQAYYDQFANIPGVLLNTTGILKENVDLLANIAFATVSSVNAACNQQVLPFGPAGV